MYHLLVPHLADGLGLYNSELCPNFLNVSILHTPRGVMASHRLRAKPGNTAMLLYQTAHVHWKAKAGLQTAVEWQAEVGSSQAGRERKCCTHSLKHNSKKLKNWRQLGNEG